jgi:hypothetical protein
LTKMVAVLSVDRSGDLHLNACACLDFAVPKTGRPRWPDQLHEKEPDASLDQKLQEMDRPLKQS